MDGWRNDNGKKLLTLYHGTCVQYSLDLEEIKGGNYLYYDWGKRWASIIFYPNRDQISLDFALLNGNKLKCLFTFPVMASRCPQSTRNS